MTPLSVEKQDAWRKFLERDDTHNSKKEGRTKAFSTRAQDYKKEMAIKIKTEGLKSPYSL